ncbi:ArnT family glycosyltransferase [Microbacterium lacticum]
MDACAARPPAARTVAAHRRVDPFAWALLAPAVLTLALTAWGVGGSMSEYYASIALSMSKSWPNFFFGAVDPAGTVTLDKIPGSFWIPALSARLFGFSPATVILPNALAAAAATVITAITARRWAGRTAGIVAGLVVATTPILVAVARSNQPETFFVLALALTAWAATKALERRSLGWLVLAGVFIAAGFQTYMLESWAVWPALAAAYLCTRQSWPRRLAHVAIAGATSLVLSLGWIIVVALIPASQRPYIGSTLSNSPWEMVFGYNGLGRFGSSTADGDAYRSFTPLALLIGAAFAAARRSGALWAQLALPIAAALSALGISIGLALGAGGTAYSLPAAIVQCVVAAVATALVVRERRCGRRMPVTTVLGVVALLLTPAVWSAVTIATPNSTNPVAGGVSAMGVGGARGMAGMGGPGAGGAAGFGGAPGSGGAAGSSGRAGGGAGAQARGGHGTGTARGDGLPAGRSAGSATGGTGGTGATGGAGITGGISANGAGGTPGATNGTGESTTTSAQIRAWVLANCTAVTDSSVTGLYSCGS